MNIEHLIPILYKDELFCEVIKSLYNQQPASLYVPGKARAVIMAALYKLLNKPFLIICSQHRDVLYYQNSFDFWLANNTSLIYPDRDYSIYQRIPEDPLIRRERLEILATMSLSQAPETPPLLLTSAKALASRTVDKQLFVAKSQVFNTNETINPVQLVQYFQSIGYRLETIVNNPGEISWRGSILDVYPISASNPVRMDFFGNTIDEMRLFDVSSQRSFEKVDAIRVEPASEMLPALGAEPAEINQRLSVLDLNGLKESERQRAIDDIEKLKKAQNFAGAEYYSSLFLNDCILDYLGQDTIVITDSLAGIEGVLNNINSEEDRQYTIYKEKQEAPIGLPLMHHQQPEISKRLELFVSVNVEQWQSDSISSVHRLPFSSARHFGGRYQAMVDEITSLAADNKRVVVISHQTERLSEILAQNQKALQPQQTLQSPPAAGEIVLVKGIVEGGWVWKDDLFVLTDYEIMGFVKQSRRRSYKRSAHAHSLETITPGDYVVHIDHGIARYAGNTRMVNAGIQKEYMVLEFAEEGRLYIPLEQINRVERYIGGGDGPPPLNHLGTLQWQKTKQQVAQAAQEIARDLLTLYSRRQVIKGFPYSEDTLWQQEMEASFPYLETPDQLKALKDIKGDMIDEKPMDRLLLGDVGYGKTEVAIRAAFKAVQDGKQVAVLVPTTLLAQQHYITFKQRLSAFPVTIESISRFISRKQQLQILDQTANGSLDILIGTHRLLQKDVQFNNLGLIIIDEEQRFGVKHKEYLKEKRQEVDVLTLSATPIPRTLYMSITGVRDLSTIETPPEDRLPVNTYVSQYDSNLIREAILREIERNGQVFFVHNRVMGIGIVAAELKQQVPVARIAVAHGKMKEEDLSSIMLDFTQGNIDVLVCTTIIESGLDVPNANTLIVNRADKLGLVQLHQLRGRVGRGTNTGYAYFLYDGNRNLKPDATNRLKAIHEMAELGSGFNIATKDLEIRGAGTLLGTRQSGHISAVGFNLYTQLLSRAVDEQKGRLTAVHNDIVTRIPETVVDLPLSMMIPDAYIADNSLRINLYHRLARVNSLNELEGLCIEIQDRFGPWPEEVANLVYGVRMKLLAKQAGIASIAYEKGKLLLYTHRGIEIERKQLTNKLPYQVVVYPDRLQLKLSPGRIGWRQDLEQILVSLLSGA